MQKIFQIPNIPPPPPPPSIRKRLQKCFSVASSAHLKSHSSSSSRSECYCQIQSARRLLKITKNLWYFVDVTVIKTFSRAFFYHVPRKWKFSLIHIATFLLQHSTQKSDFWRKMYEGGRLDEAERLWKWVFRIVNHLKMENCCWSRWWIVMEKV